MRLQLAPRARRDLEQVAHDSVATFGAAQARVYGDLIERALGRLAVEPPLPASRPRPELGQGCRSLCLAALADRAGAACHTIFYKSGQDVVVVQRLLHERMGPDRAYGLADEG